LEAESLGANEQAPLVVLIIEDESMVAMLIEDMFGDLGWEIAGIASRLDEAMDKVSSLSFDLAILDVNLNGDQTYPLAERLRRKGTPFIFATGYGTISLPGSMQGVPVLAKPFCQNDLERAVKTALK
jgi:CheY-like chemotaxis protein